MKSTKEELEKRGNIHSIDTSFYENLSIAELYQLLNSKEAFERTLAIRVLGNKIDVNDQNFVNCLLKALTIENALYTRLEIERILEKGNSTTCKELISYLGVIGNNQYKYVPTQVSKKRSYPLPRDLIARILGKMDPQNISILLDVVPTDEITKLSEVIDSIGFLTFYHRELSTIEHFEKIKEVIIRYHDNPLIVWKCIKCFSAFPFEETRQYLELLKKTENHPTILLEIERSLKLIEKRV